MKPPYLILCIIILALLSCKKSSIQPEPEPPAVAVPLPDSVLFVNTVDQPSGASALYVLNAATGASVTKYTYPADAATTWSYPVTGNNLLYTLQSNKINALNIKTGKVIWTDAINNTLTPVLHQQTFFGIRKDASNQYEAYALDATRQTTDFVWKYKLQAAPVQLFYNNEVVYLLTDATHLTALDAKTGTAKWSVAAASAISLNGIADGAFIAGNTIYNAATGAVIGTAATLNIPLLYGANTIVKSELMYATTTAYYVKTGHYRPWNGTYDLKQDYLSSVDMASGTEKQRVKFDNSGGLASNISTVMQLWNNKLIISQHHQEPLYSYGLLINDRYGFLPTDFSAGPRYFEREQRGVSSEYFIAGSSLFYYKVYYPATGIRPFVSQVPYQILAINLLTGGQQWSNDQTFDGFKSGIMAACVYSGGIGFSKYIQ